MSYHQQYEYIARMIRKTKEANEGDFDYVTTQDRLAFKKWEKGLIGLRECMNLFRKNNDIPPNVEINPHDFKGWLTEELGYKEYKHDHNHSY